MSSKVPSPGQAVYAACKQALFGYFSSLATEVAATRVGVTICCPGPMATGSDATPRVIFGATGRIVHNNTGVSSSRMDPGKAALYIAAAALEGLDECWIARHPVLAIGAAVIRAQRQTPSKGGGQQRGMACRGLLQTVAASSHLPPLCRPACSGLLSLAAGSRVSVADAVRCRGCCALPPAASLHWGRFPLMPACNMLCCGAASACAGYIVQMVPRLGWYIMKRIGPKRAKAVNEGRSGYDVGAILKTSPGQAAASAAAPPTDTAAKKRS